MNNICYFEIPADNPERAQKFYGELFGWQFEDQTMGSTPYWRISTGEGIPGGLMKRGSKNQPPVHYVRVASLDQSLEKAKSMDATVLLGKTALPGMGYFAILEDPEKNPLGLWEPDKNARGAL